MQTATPPLRTGRMTFYYGAITGLGLGVVQLIVMALTYNDNGYTSTFWLKNLFILLVWIGALLVVGTLASKRTAKVGTGTIAGLWAGVIGGAIDLVIGEIISISKLNEANSVAITHTSIALVITVVTVLYIFVWAAGIGFGAGFGALGGLIGKGTSATPVANYAGYPPQYPPMQGYPPQYPVAPMYPVQNPYPQSYSQHMPAQQPGQVQIPQTLPPQE